MTRGFEKITKEQFEKDCPNLNYDDVVLPIRSTSKSAGYDFTLIQDIKLKPGQFIMIPTGIKAYMQDNEVLKLYPRSSLGIKFHLKLSNTVGIIDADYYNNISNEGHIFLQIKNEGTDLVSFTKGITIMQGIFQNYLTIDNEHKTEVIREGGIGSTDKQVKKPLKINNNKN